MPYLYRHIRIDKNEPFYIGIGSDLKFKRAKEKTRRNNHWNNIIKKTNFYTEIIFDNLTWDEACKKEIEFIELYGRKDLGSGSLVNLTGGGEGAYKTNPSIETRKKLSQKAKGKIYSEITKKKISEGLKKFYKIHQFHPNAKKVICTNTNKIYNSINDAGIDKNINPKNLRRYLDGTHKNKTTLVYYTQSNINIPKSA
jgi:hypothetical protein